MHHHPHHLKTSFSRIIKSLLRMSGVEAAREAAQRIAGFVTRTPLLTFPDLNDALGRKVMGMTMMMIRADKDDVSDDVVD